MRYGIEKSTAKGNIKAPPSKSMAHRLLICAALSKEKCIIENLDFSQDILASIDCLKALGSQFEISDKKLSFCGRQETQDEICLNVRESGSTLRFLIPIALLTGKKISFSGSERLMQRPLEIYKKICDEQGISFDLSENTLTVRGKLQAGEYILDGFISSQFISGLLFALPLLEEDSKINIRPPFQSKPYVLMTIDALSKFNVHVELSDNVIYIKGKQKYKGQDMVVEGDWSNAAFLDAFNLIGGDVKISGLDENSLQGDKVYKEIFEQLKVENAKIDISDCPDLGPIAMAMAYKGGAVFSGTSRLRLKESDRSAAMAEELKKFGIETDIKEDTMTVYKGEIRKPALAIDSHNDHRIAMAMAVLLSTCGGELDGAEAVSKSLPSFFDMIESLGIEVKKDGFDL